MRCAWVWLMVVGCGRLDFAPLSGSTNLHVHVDAADTLAISDAGVTLDLLDVDPARVRPVPVPGDLTFGIPDRTALATVHVEARDTRGRWYHAQATVTVVFNLTTDVDVMIDDTQVPAAIGEPCGRDEDCLTNHCVTTCEPASSIWRPIAPMPVPRIGAIAALGADGKIYVFGGAPADNMASTEVYAYDDATDTWVMATPMNAARGRTAGTAIDGELYAVGGIDATATAIASAESWGPGATSWANLPPMPSTRSFHAVTSDNAGVLYVIGGSAGTSSLVTAFAGGTWMAKQPLPQPTGNLAATRLPDGRLMIVGGHDDLSSVFYAQAYAYNVGQNSWSALPSLKLGRSDLSAVTAPDGRVYAIGGYTPSTGGAPQVEAYRPGSAGWISVSNLNLGRDSNASTIGPDGRIYTFGGRPGVSTADASAEAYGPRLHLATNHAGVGDRFTYTGDGFPPLASVRLFLDTAPLSFTTSDATGAISGLIHVPDTAKATYHVVAVDDLTSYPVQQVLVIE